MKPERWQQIERLYNSTLEYEPKDRAAFLDEACSGDETLRNEVEILLAYQSQAESFIELPALEIAAKVFAEDRTLPIDQSESLLGEQIGSYKIVSRLGAGGMGEVYLAEDTQLGRRVAIKLLPMKYAADERSRKLLMREARAAAKLDHPNICAIHEVGQYEGNSFIVMQYVEGETLAGRIERSPLNIREALDLAIQIAHALSEAHSHGIIHRDIKPQNIIVNPRSQVKVLDFGLAKIVRQDPMTASEALTETFLSRPGVVMGTVPYMSPEQVRGKALDARSDIFSFGAVVYEMISGQQPFINESPAETISAILTREPPPLSLFAHVPVELERVVRKCLEKDRERRYQTMADAAVDLENILGDSTPARPTARTGRHEFAFAALALAILALIGVGAYWLYGRGKAIDSVAVLPFVNEGGDPNTEYLSDGITESLIRSLSQLPELKVISRASVFRYKGREIDPKAVGQELGVRAVLMGRVMQRDDGFLVSVELADASNNTHIWGERYDRRPSDLSAVQADIVKDIAERLRLKLTSDEERLLAKRHLQNADAYKLYLIGRYHWNKRTDEGLKKAIDYFQQAIDLEPGYALAYSGLADSYSLLGFSFDVGSLSPDEAMPKAKEAALNALQMDNTLAETHTSLAFIKLHYDWDAPGAEREFKRAIDLNPRYSNAHHWYSHFFIAMGRTEESLAEAKRALELDQTDLVINVHLGWHYIHARQYDLALEQFRKALELDANYGLTHWFMGLAYEQKGLYEEAAAELRTGMDLLKGNVVVEADLAHVYAVARKRGEAQTILDHLKEQSKKKYVSPYLIAMIYAGLGEKELAFEWLDKAYEDRSDSLVYLNVEPKLDDLRSDPRFQKLLQHVRLAP